MAACLVLGFFPFVLGARVPILGQVNLGFHELGHMLTYALPDVTTAAMGSLTQVAVPLGIGLYFLWWRRDAVGGGICLAWAAGSAQDVAVYVADAPFQRLPLIGGEHDWAFILGPEHLNMLDRAGWLASGVKGFGFVLLLAGVGCCVWGMARAVRVRRDAVAPVAEPRPEVAFAEPPTPVDMWR